ncbi:MAG: DUF192 domain-containing protein [Chloroflexota bacterium]
MTRVINQTQAVPLITQGRLADTFWRRLKGLLGAASLKQAEGLILVGEKSIHTFFMAFPIDVVYVDKNHQVIRTETNMVPFRIGPFVARSAYVLEMPVGTIAATATQTGDQLRFED